MKVEESWRELKMGDFWQKWQAYSLTFRLKFAVFGSFFFVWRRWKNVEKRRFLENWKAYSLTFLPKLLLLRHFLSLDES